MKYLQFIFLLVLITACSSTKRITESVPKEIAETPKTKDSIVEVIKEVDEPKIEIISKNPEIEKQIPFEVFNHSLWNSLLQKHVSEHGNVNYKAFKNNRKDLLNYIESLSENMPTDSWNKEDKLAYWINAYNAMTIDLIVRQYPIKSIKDIKDPWDQRFWKLGDKWHNLNEIEHDILRKMDEPRIHFAIVCASYSCPKLQNKAFTTSNLDSQLTNATKEFLNDSIRNSISENSLELSKIFQWFTKDFKQSGSLIDFLNKYSDIQISEKAKIRYNDYNWDLNE